MSLHGRGKELQLGSFRPLTPWRHHISQTLANHYKTTREREKLTLCVPSFSKIVRASTQQPRLYVGMVLILIFAEVLGLYGLIVCILMLTKSTEKVTDCQRLN